MAPARTRNKNYGAYTVAAGYAIELQMAAYNLGKDVDGGFALQGFLTAPPADLRGAVSETKSDHRVNDKKVEQCISAMLQKGSGLDSYRRPPSATDVLFAAGYRPDANNRGTFDWL
ncbi:hypothetical protein F4823DRAFT_564660 [Ustulina deusta]|nr:hypothetical protein F4823DRAFT_564660 [Ustulina deusta]